MKTIIITGANGNLGSAVTQLFLDKGYNVLATVANEEGIKEMPEHKNLAVEAIDLTNEEATAAFIEKAIKSNGTIYAALMLVGGFAAGNITATTGSDIKKQIALNFETAYYVARPLLSHMLDNNSGRLIFIGSRPSIKPSDGKKFVAYSLSKSLLFHLAEFINEEAKGTHVTATVIVPSTLDTPANRKSMPDADPSKWVSTENLAQVLDFLCSDTAAPLRETVLKVYNQA